MQIDPTTGILDIAHFAESPHHDLRPENMPIDMIVIHGISLPPGEFHTGAIEKFFLGKLDSSQHPYFKTIATMRVSSHLLIERNGAIVQFVPFMKRAWHAGESFFQGKTHCNDFSIGIELEGVDDLAYEENQYEQLGAVVRLLMQTYPAITRERIVGHSDIAPGRKTDPGPAFNWKHLDCLLQR